MYRTSCNVTSIKEIVQVSVSCSIYVKHILKQRYRKKDSLKSVGNLCDQQLAENVTSIRDYGKSTIDHETTF